MPGRDSRNPQDISPRSASTTKSSSTHADSSPAAGVSAKDRLDEINKRNRQVDEEELALKRRLVPLLAKRAYHLEDGNTWCQDWVQYQQNTHPVFGICMHHRLHPVRLPQRVIILVGSIAFGFAITNCVYLGLLSHENAGTTVNFVYDAAGKIAEVQAKYTSVELSQSTIFLLTVGSLLHSTFDISIWYLMACFCCRPGGPCQGSSEGRFRWACQNFGIYASVLLVMVAVVAATSVAIVRLTTDRENAETQSNSYLEQLAEEQILDIDEEGGVGSSEVNNNLTFLVGYALELVFALFVFYFLTSTVFFSGVLGCGRVPVLGGRPYELWRAGSKGDDGDADEEYVGDGEGGMIRAYNV